MATESLLIPSIVKEKFQAVFVVPIAGAHFVHDLYTAAIPALLPVIIEKMSLSLTMVGSLTAILQVPALLNPFIGFLADKVSMRYLVILAPAVTATLVSSLGFASSTFTLAILMFAIGVSVACFHAPSPAMIGRVAGSQVGKGMSYYMAAGELARTIGPLLTVWAITQWTLDGFFRVAAFGWLVTILLYLRLRHIPARLEKPGNYRHLIPVLRGLFLPMLFILFFRNFMWESLSTFLPIYMKSEGASLWIAGAALSILEIAGVAGALLSGTISDRMGRRQILLVMTIFSAALMPLFLNAEGWVLVPLLLALGFFTLSTAPIMLAMVQENLTQNRAVGNGLYMMMTFLLRPIALVFIGVMGDRFGLDRVYYWSAILMLFSIPAILALPKKPLSLYDSQIH